jgi:hypothetical protein
MKNTLIIMVLTLIASTVSAQDVCPEFANMVSVISEKGSSSQELGLEKAVAKQKKKGIYRGHDTSVRLEGPSAKVAVKPSQAFVFKPFNASIHPRQQVKLYPFNTKKDYRELSVGGTNMWGGSKDKKAKDDSIELTFEKVSQGCYKVTPGGALPKGEYAFSLGSNADVQGTNAGWGSTVSGQVWFGFSIK